MSDAPIYRVPPSSCPRCRALLNSTVNANGQARCARENFTVCARCSAVLVFTPAMVHRLAAAEDVDRLSREDRRVLFHAVAIVNRIRREGAN